MRGHPIATGPGWELHNDDSLWWLHHMAPESLDGVITDPPYSSGGMHRGDRAQLVATKYQQSGSERVGDYPEFYGDTRDGRGFDAWTSLWLADAWRATKPNGVIVTFIDWRMLPTMTDALQCGGWVWRGIVPWYKPTARRQMGRFGAACEYALWGSKGAMPTERGVGALPGFYKGDDYTPPYELPAYIETNGVPGTERQHVTEKPVEVMREFVKLVPAGGLVCDPFNGAGSTGVASLLEGRRFLGCELSPEYHQISCDRFSAHENLGHRKDAERGQQALFAKPELQEQ